MRVEQTRSAGEGLERSCQDTAAGRLSSVRPAAGVELLRAWFAGPAYEKHRHDTYAIGVTDSGVQVFDYRGSMHVSTPGQVVVLYPDARARTRASAIASSTSSHRRWPTRYGRSASGPTRCRS